MHNIIGADKIGQIDAIWIRSEENHETSAFLNQELSLSEVNIALYM